MDKAIVRLGMGCLMLLPVLPAAGAEAEAGDSRLAASRARLQLGRLPVPLAALDPLGPTLNAPAQRFLTSAEFERRLGAAVGTVSIGVLREAASVTGPQQSPALAMYNRPSTSFTAATLGYALTPHASVTAMVSAARTEGLGAPDSLLAQVSSVRTLAYSLSWARRQWLLPGDSLTLTLSVPARVRSGTLAGSGSVALTGEPGALPYGTAMLNLRPTATEHDVELRYTLRPGGVAHQGRLSAAIMWRVHPGHDAAAQPEYLLGLRYVQGF
ncbi:hypothetical protein [Duganella qianjiadongensis]|uniref:Uncharacterized protein n=1 Tax=Duganella qianjiadongensis TaxID=2692176 RepID=A0ABW9VKC5_9BURK|nr:hypothetical protein [Duganella qianjiadongensis]MYM40054.1 hypothetical protein [Duganella qianjiadongensis]